MQTLEQLKEHLENSTMAELRSMASKKYEIAYNPKSTKEDIIYAILEKIKGGEAAPQAFGALAPGWARVQLHQTGERSDADVIMAINGYVCFLPMNKEIDVPIKVVDGILRASKEKNYTAGAYAPTPHKDGDNIQVVEAFSYPFSVIGINPGPDPRPSSWQIAREKVIEQKREFYKHQGYWPSTKKVLAEWQAQQRKANG